MDEVTRLPAGLAARLARSAQRLVNGVVVLVGGISLCMICWLLLQRSDAQLHSVGGELKLVLGARLDSVSTGLAELSQRTLVRNALVDPSGREAYVLPSLREHRTGSSGLRSLWLTDQAGRLLVDGRDDQAEVAWSDAARQLALRCVVADRLQQQLLQEDGHWRLLMAYPVVVNSVLASEAAIHGALVGELDLDHLLQPIMSHLAPGFWAEVRSGDDVLAMAGRRGGLALSQTWPVLLRAGDSGATQAFVLRVHQSARQALAPAVWIGLLYALLSAALLVLVRRRVMHLSEQATRPLRSLRDAAQRVTNEGLDSIPQLCALEARDGGAELQDLAHSFAAMLLRLQEAQTSLEQTVAHRTAELAQAKDRLDSTLASLTDGVYSLSVDRDELLFASPPVAGLLGAAPGEVPLVRSTMNRLLDVAGLAELEAAFMEAAVAGHAIATLALPGDAEGPRWLENRMTLVRDAQGLPLRIDGILADVTTTMRAQQAREKAVSGLKILDRGLASTGNGVLILSLRPGRTQAVYANPAMVTLSGDSVEQLLADDGHTLTSHMVDDELNGAMRTCVTERRDVHLTTRLRRATQEVLWCEITISPMVDERIDPFDQSFSGELKPWVHHIVLVIDDVTERRRAEHRLHDEFARLDTIFALSPDGFVSFDADGRAMSINPAFERLMNLSAPTLMGMDSAVFDARMNEVIEQRHLPGNTHWLGDTEPAHVQSEVLVLKGLPQRVVVCSRRDCEAPNVSRVLHLRDITRETEVDRMKSEFLSTAAHELRTPLASIRGFSDLLLMRKFDEARTRDLLETINRQAVWLSNMINELLDLARIEARKGQDFRLESLSAREVIEAGVKSLLMPGDARCVRLELPEDLPPVRMDRAKFQQAMTNVLSNAYKYSPAGGEIALRVLRRTHGDQSQLGIAVSDAGIGMSPEHVERAFERFFRADASGNIPGTGLGLALVREIIELHGGEVQLVSTLGVGTTVTMWLPVEASAHQSQRLVAA